MSVNALPGRLLCDQIETPIGTALLITDDLGQFRALNFDDREAKMSRQLARFYPGVVISEGAAPSAMLAAFGEYFSGGLDALASIPTATGGTDFQRRVWAALKEIPAGKTVSYREISERIGTPAAVRAVGMANGANPISLVVPCHRVIGADGSLTGYGGGLDRKQWLLNHEGAAVPRMLSLL